MKALASSGLARKTRPSSSSHAHASSQIARGVGVVFISLDDGEIENLREICNEVFGEQNFLAQCVRKRRDSQANLSKNISPIHEYVVLYAKSNGNLLNKISAHINERDYKNPDNDPRGPYISFFPNI